MILVAVVKCVCVQHHVHVTEQVKEEVSTGAAVSFDIPWQSLSVVELVYSSLPEGLKLLQTLGLQHTLQKMQSVTASQKYEPRNKFTGDCTFLLLLTIL